MKRNTEILLFVLMALVAFLLTLAGCENHHLDNDDYDYNGQYANFYCPQCNEDVYWVNSPTNSFTQYGRIVPGYFGGDSWGWKLEYDCGWWVDPNHQGGTGNTLELTSCNDSVRFIWAYQALSEIVLRENWTGQTWEGVGIGCSLDEFLYVYPDFTLYYADYNGSIYQLTDLYYWNKYGYSFSLVYATFNRADRLVQLDLWGF